MKQEAKILVFDIETAPILGYVWGLWENNVGLNQIHSDWYILSWSAKWLGAPPSEIMYMDQRRAKNIEDDSKLLQGIWKLLDDADVVVTQNGKAFDQKKLQARFLLSGMKPPSSYQHIDTYQIAKKNFALTSNKLEYMSDKLCKKYKKLKYTAFPGFELWKAVLRGDVAAWREMEKYNKRDVLALEELYTKLRPWDSTVNFALYSDEPENKCPCGSKAAPNKNGYCYTSVGRYQRFSCADCGAERRGRTNLLSKEKRDSLTAKVSR